MMNKHLRRAAVCAALTLGLAASQLPAATATVAGLTFDIDNSITEATVTIDGTLTPSNFPANVNGNSSPIDEADHVGALLPGGNPSDAVDLTGGTNGSTGRAHVVVGWGAGNGVQNLPGDDVHIFESAGGNTPTEMFVEPFGVAVREAGSSSFSGYRYEHIDLGDLGPLKSRTSFDLSDFGIASGAYIDAVEIISLHNASATTSPNLEDRVDDSSGEGNLSLDAGNATGFAILRGPNADMTGTPFPDGGMDADIVYVVAENVGVIPEPTLSFTDDFNADTSADYFVVKTATSTVNAPSPTEDATAVFAYDYSAFTGADGTTIPEAPNSGDSMSLGLRLEANNGDGTGEAAGINLYPMGLDIPAGTDFRMSFDCWTNWDFNLFTAFTGTTQYAAAGLYGDPTLPMWSGAQALTNGASGLLVSANGDGDSGLDYHLYVGDSAPGGGFSDVPVGTANGWASAANDHADPYFQALFPSIAVPGLTVGNPDDSGNFTTRAGATGKQWVEWRVTSSGGNVVWTLNGTTVFSATNPTTFDSGFPMLGYYDQFNSVSGTPSDQFSIIDNLVIEELTTTSVGDYSLYR